MQEQLYRIIAEINRHTEWDLNLKIRYAYIELGKLIHKDAMFFYTIQNNLLSQGKETLQYSIDEIDDIMNTPNNFDYKTICRNAAEMLHYIFLHCNIESEIRRTIATNEYTYEDKKITIRHYFVVVTGNDNKKYFLTINPDLPNIQIGKMTSHFANRIDYLTSTTYHDEEGRKIVKETPTYEGEEIKYSVMTPEEIRKLDEKLGYLKYQTLDQEEQPHYEYTDYFFNIIEQAYKTDKEYIANLASQTEFFYDLANLINGTKSFAEIIEREDTPSEEELESASISFKLSDKSLEDWQKIKQFIILNVAIKLNNYYKLQITDEEMNLYNRAVINCNYDIIFNNFKNKFIQNGWDDQKLKKYTVLNPLLKMRQTNHLMMCIDCLAKSDKLSPEDLNKKKEDFFTGIYDLALLFVPKEYLHLNKNSLSSTFITHKIILTFKKIFDIGHKTAFNNLELAEQVVIIKEIVNMILQDIKVDYLLPAYNKEKSPIKNRILSTIIFDKVTKKPYYLMCVKSTKIEQIDFAGFNPIIYDMQDNKLDTQRSLTEIMSKYYVIKDADMKLMIEEIDQNIDTPSDSIKNPR